MRQWMRTVALGAAMVLVVAVPAMAQEAGDDGPRYGPAEQTVQATEQIQHQKGPGPSEEPARAQERERVRDGSGGSDCDGVPEEDPLRDRDRDRDRDGTCTSECDGTPDREQLQKGRMGTAADEGTETGDRLRLRDGTCTTCSDDGCSPDVIRDRLRTDPRIDKCDMQLLLRCCIPKLGLIAL